MNSEDNKLVADFMGYEKLPNGKYEVTDHPWEEHLQGNCCDYSPEYMCFDVEWNWLMPVAQKINSMSDMFRYEPFMISGEGELYISCYIGDAYRDIVGFIKWYNKQKEL